MMIDRRFGKTFQTSYVWTVINSGFVASRQRELCRKSQITNFMGPTWAHLGPVGPRWAPCWPHEPCCQGCFIATWIDVLDGMYQTNWKQHQQQTKKYNRSAESAIYPIRYAQCLVLWYVLLWLDCQLLCIYAIQWHDDVIKWKHFPRYWTLCEEFISVTSEFPAQRPVTRSFDVFFDLRLNKRLSKQSRCWWFEMPLRPLWRHCNELHSSGLFHWHLGNRVIAALPVTQHWKICIKSTGRPGGKINVPFTNMVVR